MESLTRHLGARVFHTIGSLGSPLIVFGVWVVGSDAHHATLCHRFLVPLYLDGGYHCLTRKTESARRTMIEDIPLAVDFLYRAMGVVPRIHAHKMCAVLVGDDAARIYQYTTRTPRTKGRVAIGIAQGRIGGALSVFRTAISREHHHILVAHLADAGCLKEIEVSGVLSLVEGGILCALGVADYTIALTGRNEVIVNIGAGAHGIHVVRVELIGGGVAEAIEHVCTETAGIVGVLLIGDVLHEYRRVEIDERTLYAGCAFGIEVDGSERSVGPVALAHHSHTTPAA